MNIMKARTINELYALADKCACAEKVLRKGGDSLGKMLAPKSISKTTTQTMHRPHRRRARSTTRSAKASQ
jgi:uncharacterized protein (DUF1697 family)